MPPRPIPAAIREDLGDARLLLETAAHNLQAVLRAGTWGPESTQALSNLRTQLHQVLATLERLTPHS